jgi:hypothetical protein
MSKLLHKIKAFLYANFLTENPNDFTARVSSERSLSVKDICIQAVTRGGAATTAEAMEHNVNLFLKEMSYQLCDGYSVNTGYFTATTQIRGVFDSPDENFNPDKHSVLFQFNQGELLRKEIPSIEVQIMGVGETSIYIAQVLDVKSGSANDLLTPGRNLKITGSRLKLAGEHADVGVYFTNESTGSRTKVDVSEIVINNPSELIIIIPELAAGSYRLSITNQYTVGALLKEPRTTVFDAVLMVQ